MWIASLTGQWVVGSIAGLLLGIGMVRFAANCFAGRFYGDILDWCCLGSFVGGLILALILYVQLGF